MSIYGLLFVHLVFWIISCCLSFTGRAGLGGAGGLMGALGGEFINGRQCIVSLMLYTQVNVSFTDVISYITAFSINTIVTQHACLQHSGLETIKISKESLKY